MWPNSAPLQDIRLWNLSDLEYDLWRSLKVKCYDVIGLSLYAFLLSESFELNRAKQHVGNKTKSLELNSQSNDVKPNTLLAWPIHYGMAAYIVFIRFVFNKFNFYASYISHYTYSQEGVLVALAPDKQFCLSIYYNAHIIIASIHFSCGFTHAHHKRTPSTCPEKEFKLLPSYPKTISPRSHLLVSQKIL